MRITSPTAFDIRSHCSSSFASCVRAGPGERVKLRVPAALRYPPLRPDPALLLQPVQSRIQRSLADLQHFLRNLLDPLGDRPAMLRL